MNGATLRHRRVDPLGALLAGVGGLALASLPLVVFKANRIVPGEPRALFDVLPGWAAWSLYAVLALVAMVGVGVATIVSRPRK